jgi:hypothetical protein
MNDGMQMGPPAGGDPIGLAIIIVGVVVTLWTVVFAIRASVWPGESDPRHPKYLILKDDR